MLSPPTNGGPHWRVSSPIPGLSTLVTAAPGVFAQRHHNEEDFSGCMALFVYGKNASERWQQYPVVARTVSVFYTFFYRMHGWGAMLKVYICYFILIVLRVPFATSVTHISYTPTTSNFYDWFSRTAVTCQNCLWVPWSASSIVAYGPARTRDRSRTRMPSKGSPFVLLAPHGFGRVADEPISVVYILLACGYQRACNAILHGVLILCEFHGSNGIAFRQ